MQPRSALRLLLRAVDKRVTSVAGNKQWRQAVLEQFRSNAGLQDAAQQQQLLLLAQEYADLINNIAHHRELLARYNLGVDSEERNKRMVAATAARVGFALPQPGQPAPPPRQRQQQQQQEQQQQEHAASQEPQQETGQQQQQQQAAGLPAAAGDLDSFVEQQLEMLREQQQQLQQQSKAAGMAA